MQWSHIMLAERGATRYRRPLLAALIAAVGIGTLLSCSAYTVLAQRAPPNHQMVATIPFVAIGIGRYLALVHHPPAGGSPDAVLFEDWLLVGCVAGWIVTSGLVLALYG
jgi:hypothetical protein